MNIAKTHGSLAKDAISAALQRQNSGIQEMQKRVAQMRGEQIYEKARPTFAGALKDGIREVNAQVAMVDELPKRIVSGEVDLHEAAAQIQMSKITFEFTMELRNKFIDAYREIMRMSV